MSFFILVAYNSSDADQKWVFFGLETDVVKPGTVMESPPYEFEHRRVPLVVYQNDEEAGTLLILNENGCELFPFGPPFSMRTKGDGSQNNPFQILIECGQIG